MPASQFGSLLKERRRTQDLTQERLSELVGCAVVTLKKIEAGRLRPSRQICARLAGALAIPEDEHAAFIALARGGVDALPPDEAPPIRSLSVEEEAGRMVRGYLLRERIGAGGFGVVYRAYQPAVGRDVAIKVIAPAYADQPAFIRRFEIEAQTIARLEHPHIVPLYDYWREPGSAYLVMRWMRGGSLVDGLRHGPWTAAAVTPVIEQIGAALATAHRAGIVHRDVKPANVLLDPDGNAYLADFGIAKGIDATYSTTTATSAIVGSPDYLSPEQLRNEPVTPQTDIYSLGVLLYELLIGSNPFAGLSPAERLQRQLYDPLPDLRAHRPELAALNMVLRRATAKLPSERHLDVAGLIADLIQILAPARQSKAIGDSQTTIGAPGEVDAATISVRSSGAEANPYKGLRSFQEADADQFFGRSALTQRLLARLAPPNTDRVTTPDGARFLAVVGPSGSGKSSVVKAGLLPALRRGDLASTEHWFIAELLPGPQPLEELEAALLRVAVNPPPSLLEQLREDERGLTRAVKRSLPADERVVLALVIDQFEEIFTLVDHEEERLHLLRSLLVAATDPHGRLVLIITLRADFYDRPLRYPGFSELIRTGTEVVTPLTSAELEHAIIKPAARVKVTVEPALVAAIARDVEAQPGALPLVQYALTELFERRDRLTMTLDAYRSIGGIAGAVARRADALYGELDEDAQEAARQVFLRLVTIGEGAEDTRRRVRRSELDALAPERVLAVYGRYRLLTFDRDPLTGESTVEVSHEALIRVWGRLRGWLDDSRSALLAHRRLVLAATEWAQSGEDASFLAIGARLAQFEELATDGDLALNDEEQHYLDASLAERERLVELDRAREAALRDSLLLSEAQRLAAETNRLLQVGGNAELIALLAIHSIRMRYTPQGDEALAGAALLNYSRHIYNHYGLNLTITADGRTVIIAGNLFDAHAIDLATGEDQGAFTGGHTDLVHDACLSPNGRWLATVGADGRICIWEMETRAILTQWVGHEGPAWKAAFSPDGTKLLTGGNDSKARLWDVGTGRELHCFEGHENRVGGVTFAPNGRLVATASLDGTARVWDAETGIEQVRFLGHGGSLISIAIGPDSCTVATAGADATVRLWNGQTGDELHCCRIDTEPIRGVVFSPDGSFLASCCEDGAAHLWDVTTGRNVARYVGHTLFAFAVAFTPDGAQLVTTSGDGTSRLWDVHFKPYLLRFEGIVACFSPDGCTIATGDLDGVVRLWDARTGELVRVLSQHQGSITRVAFTNNGRWLLTGNMDTTAIIWDVVTGRELRTLRGHTLEPRAFISSPDDRLLLTASEDRTARIWDAATGALIHRLTEHDQHIFDAAFSPDGRLIATGSVDGTIRLWDTASGVELRVLPEGAASIAFTPDGSTLISADWGGLIRMWDVASGAEIGSWLGHFTTIWALRVSPSGRYLLSGSSDRTARLWDLQTRQELRRFAGHTSGIFSVDFSPDERYVLTGSNDGTARLWDIDYATTINYLQSRLLRDFTDHERAQYGIDKTRRV